MGQQCVLYVLIVMTTIAFFLPIKSLCCNYACDDYNNDLAGKKKAIVIIR